MVRRWTSAAVLALALAASGCGKQTEVTPTQTSSSSASPSSTPSPSASASTAADAPQGTLEPNDCFDVAQANLDLSLASNSEEAQKAADVLTKYGPPGPVQEAIDHFVATGGPHISDDEQTQEFNDRIDQWVQQVCPV